MKIRYFLVESKKKSRKTSLYLTQMLLSMSPFPTMTCHNWNWNSWGTTRLWITTHDAKMKDSPFLFFLFFWNRRRIQFTIIYALLCRWLFHSQSSSPCKIAFPVVPPSSASLVLDEILTFLKSDQEYCNRVGVILPILRDCYNPLM